MKRLLCLSFLALSLGGYGQSSFVVRPSLGNPDLTDASGKGLQMSTAGVGQTVKLVVPVYNNSFAVAVRAGSGRLEIDLGPSGGGLEVVSVGVSGVFSWDKPVTRSGHTFITGRLVRDLGASYVGSETLLLRGTAPQNTRVRAHWIDSTPPATKRSDIFAEMQVRVVGLQLSKN